MSGIYIHIPFCRQACYYCDFHFSTSLKNKREFIDALKKEIELHKDYLTSRDPLRNKEDRGGQVRKSFSRLVGNQNLRTQPGEGIESFVEVPSNLCKGDAINTVYFGGGTPSVLSEEEIPEIFDWLSKFFSITQHAEITLEANPDDLSKEKLSALAQTPVNRLSIGVQSFSEQDLKFLNRIHSVKDAIDSVNNAKDAGLGNISIDLIYGIQTLTNEQWEKNIETAIALDVSHISCYALTIEKRTALYSFIKKKKVESPDEEKTAQQFEMLMNMMEEADFVQYEISNFCRKGVQVLGTLAPKDSGGDFRRGLKDLGGASQHNMGYWTGEKYLGLGPSAHSYDGDSRQWNVSGNAAYIRSVKRGIIPFEKEILSETQKFNEYIMTSLRTIRGMDMREVRKKLRMDGRVEEPYSHFVCKVNEMIEQTFLEKDGDRIFLTRKGKMFADRVTRELLYSC